MIGGLSLWAEARGQSTLHDLELEVRSWYLFSLVLLTLSYWTQLSLHPGHPVHSLHTLSFKECVETTIREVTIGIEEELDALRVRRALVRWTGSLWTALRFACCLLVGTACCFQ